MTIDGPDPIRNDRRRARKQATLPPDAACVLCGISNPTNLLQVRRSLLHHHHVPGRVYADELTVPLCQNCHAVETQAQHDLAVDLRGAARLPERLVSVLRALGVFFQRLGARLLVWADQLAALVAALDRDCPGWRALPEAQG
jgi:hypothetical protein